MFVGHLAVAVGARRVGPRVPLAPLVIGVMVVSHGLLDWVTHRRDLPLWPGSALFGLGLWNSLPGAFVVEGVLSAVSSRSPR